MEKYIMWVRSILSLIICGFWWGFGIITNPVQTLLTAEAARGLFDNSDFANITSNTYITLLQGMSGYVHFLLLILLVVVWFGAIKKVFTPATLALFCIIGLGFLYMPTAHAYYDQKDI